MTLDILVQFQNTLELGNLGRYNKRIFRTLHFGESESSTLGPRSCILEATQYMGDSCCWFSPLLCKITPRILKFNILLFIHLFIQFLFHFCLPTFLLVGINLKQGQVKKLLVKESSTKTSKIAPFEGKRNKKPKISLSRRETRASTLRKQAQIKKTGSLDSKKNVNQVTFF